MRIGHGIDVHQLVKGRKLILGGVEIPSDLGLLGHSDADVVLHAICDALLGAAALGDIGKHFPDTNPEYKDINSLKLLSHVGKLIQEQGYSIVNLDVTLILQKPKVAAYIDVMRQNISKTLDIDISKVSVKATTSETLGYEGESKGATAHCICLLQ